jgi:hypothetical protein
MQWATTTTTTTKVIHCVMPSLPVAAKAVPRALRAKCEQWAIPAGALEKAPDREMLAAGSVVACDFGRWGLTPSCYYYCSF